MHRSSRLDFTYPFSHTHNTALITALIAALYSPFVEVAFQLLLNGIWNTFTHRQLPTLGSNPGTY
jgi:hypothetical protein